MTMGSIMEQNGSTKPEICPSKPRNIIIFMPDQLRYDCLGCSGNKIIKTPNIDAFANKGTRFTNCFAQASVCAQSRCSMFLGQYPHVSGHRSLNTLVQSWEGNLFKTLKDGGYHVAHLGTRGHIYAEGVTELNVTEYGFLETPDFADSYRDMKNVSDKESLWSRLYYTGQRQPAEAFDFDEGVIRSAEKWLQSNPPEPFCLFLPLIWPHCPFEAEEPYFSMYDRSTVPLPKPLSAKTGYEPLYMNAIRERFGLGRADGNTWAEIIATYYGMISRLDDQFGRLMKIIENRSLWSSTVTMFFTDHGEYLGDHGLIEKWPSGLSDSMVHEPLIIGTSWSLPRIVKLADMLIGGADLPRGAVVDAMCEMVDIVPTILQLCNLPENFPHNDKSLLPTMSENVHNYVHKSYAFSEGGFLMHEEPLLEQAGFPYDLKAALQHENTALVGKAISCRSPEWTYVYRLYEHAELYNRTRDKSEQHNLAGLPEFAGIETMFREIVFQWLVETSDLLPWKKDLSRYPVALKTPKEQMEDRLKTSRNRK